MFESLKKKLSGLVEKLTKKVDEKAERELQQEASKEVKPPAEAPRVKASGFAPQPELLKPVPPAQPEVLMPAPAKEQAPTTKPELRVPELESPAFPEPEAKIPAAAPEPEVKMPAEEAQKEPTLFTSLADKTRSLRDKLNILKKLGGAESTQQGQEKAETVKPELAPKPEPKPDVKAPQIGLAPGPKPKIEATQIELKPEPKPALEAPIIGLKQEPKPEVEAPAIDLKPAPKPALRVEQKPPAQADVKLKIAPEAEAPAEKPMSLKERILGAVLETEISGSDIDEILSGFEVDLLENDVALEVVECMIADMRSSLKGKKVKRGEVEKAIRDAIRLALEDVLSKGKRIDLLEEIRKAEKPYKLAFVGINGTGKTTTIAKIANLCLQNGFEPVIAASDTFRAASIEQLEVHANRLGVKLVKHKYGSDAAAVAYDAIEHAKAKGKQVVLIDTAGRMQTNANLMDELRKILRVANPNLVVFVGDSLTGNDAVEQARTFNEVRVDAVILTKSDADAKGGACLSISYAIGKPVLYLGTGQNYPDLIKFTPEWFMEKVGA